MLVLAASIVKADNTVVVSSSETFGTWEGWGTSLCWWANQFGDRDDMADILFTQNDVKWDGHRLPGLGLNIVRYNLGGSGPGMTASPKNPPFKQIEAFWLDWKSRDPKSQNFDWSRDAKQRTMLTKAKERGADRFELFVNSPVWWMCNNHNTSGANDGRDNLQNWNYTQFAASIAITVKQAADDWGIPFQSVAPFNEPSANWWKSDGTQEGCHFEIGTQQKVIKHLRAELNQRGLNKTKITASDENSVDEAIKSLQSLDAGSRKMVEQINVHGYAGLEAYRGPNRGYLSKLALGKTLWVSEYGEADGSGRTLMDSIVRDFTELHPTGWVYWQAFDSGGWGLIQSNPGDNWVGPANPKFFVKAQFTRHIRPGMTILSTNAKNSIAAFDPASKKTVIVTINLDNNRQRFNYDLSQFRATNPKVTRWITNTTGTTDYAKDDELKINGQKIATELPATSIETLEIEGTEPINPLNAGKQKKK